jgi:hypothetical protein
MSNVMLKVACIAVLLSAGIAIAGCTGADVFPSPSPRGPPTPTLAQLTPASTAKPDFFFNLQMGKVTRGTIVAVPVGHFRQGWIVNLTVGVFNAVDIFLVRSDEYDRINQSGSIARPSSYEKAGTGFGVKDLKYAYVVPYTNDYYVVIDASRGYQADWPWDDIPYSISRD